jgi:hypothetical protein
LNTHSRFPAERRLDGAELVNGSLDIEGIQGDVQAAWLMAQ